VRRGGLCAKHIGLKRGAIGKSLGAHIGNMMGTWREHIGNKGKMKKSLPSPAPHSPPQKNLKEKIKSRHFKHMLSLPIGCMKFLLPKLFIIILAWANTPLINWGYLFYYIGC